MPCDRSTFTVSRNDIGGGGGGLVWGKIKKGEGVELGEKEDSNQKEGIEG